MAVILVTCGCPDRCGGSCSVPAVLRCELIVETAEPPDWPLGEEIGPFTELPVKGNGWTAVVQLAVIAAVAGILFSLVSFWREHQHDRSLERREKIQACEAIEDDTAQAACVMVAGG